MGLKARWLGKGFQLLSMLLYIGVLTLTGCDLKPAELQVNPSSLDFGESSTEQTLSIANLGNEILEWRISFEDSVSWCLFTPTAGIDSRMVTVTVDRSKLLPGKQRAVLLVESNEGNIKIAISATRLSNGGIDIHESLPQ